MVVRSIDPLLGQAAPEVRFMSKFMEITFEQYDILISWLVSNYQLFYLNDATVQMVKDYSCLYNSTTRYIIKDLCLSSSKSIVLFIYVAISNKHVDKIGHSRIPCHVFIDSQRKKTNKKMLS